MNILSQFCFFILLLLSACTHKNEKNNFKRIPQQIDDFAILRNQYIKEVALAFTYMGLPKPTITSHPGSLHLTIQFGKLTENQFLIAKKKFSYSKLPTQFLPNYIPNKNYELTDFLPPKMQALMNKRTHGTLKTKMPDWFVKHTPLYLNGDSQIDLYNDTNCWGTVHDILLSARFPDIIHLFNIDLINDHYYRNKNYFDRIDPKSIQPYDIILEYDDYEGTDFSIQHASLYLGNYLVFQKDGLSEVDHYRITLYKEGRTGREIYRPKLNVPIKTPEELFGMKNPKMTSQLTNDLKDLKKLDFFKSLILVPSGPGTANSFLMSNSIKLKIKKNSQTLRYEFDSSTFPGTEFQLPLQKKQEDY